MDEKAKVSRRQVIAAIGMTGATVLMAGATSAYSAGRSVTDSVYGNGNGNGKGDPHDRTEINHFVNVKRFGAKGDGVTDDSAAFAAAFGNGSVSVYVPEGTYRVRGLRVPSNTTVRGAGIDCTIIKLTDDAPNGEWVVTNSDYEAGNTNIVLEDFTADWNINRPNVRRVGGQASSCITLANASYCWIQRVKAVDALLHCFDVTSPQYVNEGDTVYSDKPSRYVWITDCIADGHEDDGFTTHHSEYIYIENCYSTGASKAGKYFGGVGFEIDDGSRNVWVTNCVSEGNWRGFMAKGHHDAPAAYGVHFTNCTSIREARSFELLHINHHLSTEPVSPNAYDVTMTNCVAYYPQMKPVSLDITQRALSIAAYARVKVNGFTAIGDPAFDYKNQPVIAVQTKARNVTLSDIHVTGFTTASTDITIAGGANSGDHIVISNVSVHESSPNGIFIGTGLKDVMVSNIQLQGTNKAGSVGLKYYADRTYIGNISVSGYAYTAYAPNGVILEEVTEVPQWQSATLQNGWVPSSADQSPKFAKNSEGFVHVFGTVQGGTAGSSTPLFTLPSKYRPKRAHTFLTAGSEPGAMNMIRVLTNGKVTTEQWSGTGSNILVRFDQIIFPTII
ncbi:hypothetical protein PAESOLCIP111_06602 [Paenibacillus solanacearum]|uniref:Rhamnogalacturonase A/B/Epimerase-like pectate lyase domain-containing protein n=1 Tax=Paenibacillus solanacearum TaxID=2048548 RepID=A0A916K9G4_9BACL|nr:glycoside hydrolase family 55 protein [Paenibacillus solanacearum]CAG7652686.1 hypothetical protein PAESOLCIP111_06602 [Paenibacillus solanacearum]